MRRPLSPFALLLSVAALALSGCAMLSDFLTGAVLKPELRVTSVDVAQASFDGMSLNVNVEAKNPNAFPIDLARLGYQLTVDGHALTSGQSRTPYHVPASGTATLALPVSFRFEEVTSAVADLLSRPSVDYKVAAQLGFDLEGVVIDIPLEHAGTLSLPRPPRIDVASAHVGEAGLSGATLSLELGVANPNPFPLPAGAMHYRLLIAGAQVSGGTFSPGPVAANDRATLTLPLSVDFLAAGAAVVEAFAAGRAPILLDGELDYGSLKLPLHVETTVELR